MTDKKIGEWDFKNFFQRQPEATAAEKQAYAYYRIMSKIASQQPIHFVPATPQPELTEQEHHGIFYVENKRINITTFPFQIIDQMTPMPNNGSNNIPLGVISFRQRIRSYADTLEKILEKNFPDFSCATHFGDGSKLMINEAGEEAFVPALIKIEFEHATSNYQGYIIPPDTTTKRALYQVSNLTVDRVISAGVVYTTKDRNNSVYEIKGILTRGA